ncbi:MAG: peptidoglycan DD-metalloendopeptidase family protein, partial [Pseudomonadales bacterium]|nr:peptidoglycan DD-metalloendopeptidase family protein [Pseudomonadales bacterium]
SRLPDATAAPEAWYHGHRVLVTGHDGHWQAVVGIPLTQTAGDDTLHVTGLADNLHFTVAHRDYPEQHIVLTNPHQVNPSSDELSRIHGELKQELEDFATFDGSVDPHALSLSQLPVTSHQVLSAFGLKRFFNGEPRAPHSGLDLKAAEGAPVTAPAAGRVLMTQNLFFNGNTVMLDEGQGLVSMYCHLSQIAVHEGQQIKPGELLGYVGHTGRATGPHLHWSVSLNGVRIDPRLLLTPELNAILLPH